MGKDSANGRREIGVCLIEYNSLAARELLRVLKTADQFAISCQNDLLGPHRLPKSLVSVFVLDRGTLADPLTKCLRYLLLRKPDAKTILLDEQFSPEDQIRLVSLCVKGFVTYGDAENQLSSAIRAVAHGHLWVANDILEQYVAYSLRLSQPTQYERDGLTRRERNIIEFLKRRSSDKEISSSLGISSSTVKFHLSNIFAKLGVRDRHSVAEVIASKSPSKLAELRLATNRLRAS